ncbi:transcriptional regulator, BadM/Rrf2 family [Alkalithermobacter thermoalcaliphilus JW-YL-7 = DSM 7308]|uniref:Transcriptional regulator, BadM/Rrf2 family n=1 Tax=Alkalithermobacter thermoalcaliphilus JW-YL-7 = DSM 7308 TaxID=1121328 RepID=A0A150FQR5_CLOPD|nr:transcriptional regulator, BadM/Rrf2 family [[Clostridium] paradoxum JW-YL-7 = DSM 7308]SHK75932.1 transcriptional regulator, BadM/Rrf2 family [[Clostridium] paradoxum JW-YL-7 = DSM 7308]
MKLSTKGRYGLKAMFELALNQENSPVPLKYIANKQDLSDQYLEQIFSSLRKAGLIKSVRGAQGGYLLSKDASKITVGEIIRVLEGPIAPAECVLDTQADCERSDYCVTKGIWEKIKDSIDSVIDSVTLQDMVNDYKRKTNKEE